MRRTARHASTLMLAAGSLLIAQRPLAAQGASFKVNAEALLAATRLDPSPGGAALTEFRLEQPMIMAHASLLDHGLRFHTTLNFEAVTMPDGVLTMGIFGEGYMDRRHPHTVVHELMASVVGRLAGPRGPRVSLSAGKGFVAFGTDDPMSRPALRFPVNHHWAQVLERLVFIPGIQLGPVTLEASVFNGDEPESPGDFPSPGGRFGDSHAGRLTVTPMDGVEAQVSRAWVNSPEHQPGAGAMHRHWSGSVRLEHAALGGDVYGLAEYARVSMDETAFVFPTWLVEAAWRRGAHQGYYRFERTDRPEEERTLEDPFRTVRPHVDDAILGVTRWDVHTAGYRVIINAGRARLEPGIEASFGDARNVDGGIFRPEDFYGKNRLWSLTAAIRVAAGRPHRMGRYGVSGVEHVTGEHEGH